MSSVSSLIVISQNKQQNKYLKLKAFAISLLLHSLLLLLILKLASQHLNPNIEKLDQEKKKTLISLSAYKVFTPKHTEVKRKIVQKQKISKPKPQVKQVFKKVEKKELKVPKEKTLQETQQKQALVESPEAFTPHVPDTEQKLKETKKELTLQNSPLSDSKHTQLALIRSLIQNALKYPAIARRLHLEGVVVVSFSLSTTGEVSDLQLIQSSNSSVLDKRALHTVSSLDGEFPKLDKKLDLKIPIAFSLQQS